MSIFTFIMRPKIKLIGDDGRKAVHLALEQPESKDLPKDRLIAVKLAYTGHFTLAEIADQLNRGRSRVAIWIASFRKHGVEGLRMKARGGVRKESTKVTPELEQSLKEELNKGKWKRAQEIQEWAEQNGVILTRKGVYSWLRRIGAKLKSPRKSHIKKDPVKTKAFREHLSTLLSSITVPKGVPVRIWVADEHRYGLISVLRKVWTLRGCHPTAPYNTRYQWGYLYSALEVDGAGKAQALFADGVCLEMSRAFLDQIGRSDPSSTHIVIWDQAGFHQKTTTPPEELPENVRILSLPAYSPELNPVERIGDLIKDRTGNTIFKSLDDIQKSITEKLRPIWETPERVRSLIGNGWMLDQVNDF